MSLFQTISKSWKLFVANKKLLPVVVLVDVLFVYAMTRLHFEVFSRASTLILQLSAMISSDVAKAAESASPPTLDVLQTPEFINLYNQFLKHITIFMLGALLVWLVCKGITWLVAHKMVEKKVDWKNFALKFFGMTILWFAAFLLLTIIVLNLIHKAVYGAFPLIGQTGTNTVSLIAFWLLAYFVFISYSIVPRQAFKNTFIIGVKHWKKLLPVHITSSLVLFVSIATPTLLVNVNVYLPIIFGVFIALPAIAWTRILWVTAINNVMR